MLRLQFERTRRGWTQRSLGALVGMPQSTISDFERGVVVPQTHQLEGLALVLDVAPPAALLLPVTVETPEFAGAQP